MLHCILWLFFFSLSTFKILQKKNMRSELRRRQNLRNVVLQLFSEPELNVDLPTRLTEKTRCIGVWADAGGVAPRRFLKPSHAKELSAITQLPLLFSVTALFPTSYIS